MTPPLPERVAALESSVSALRDDLRDEIRELRAQIAVLDGKLWRAVVGAGLLGAGGGVVTGPLVTQAIAAVGGG